ncbi:MAG TPA: TonB-dependent receptor, partial [Longimicrobiales bacterium]|nr:TonB-dependent receptor [Longimicrobiales bacterium]
MADLRLYRFCLLAALCFAAGAAPGAAQDSAVLSGTIVDEQGQPVPGMAVSARGAVAESGVTNRSGAYRLGPLPEGTYVVRVEAIGYRSAEREVRVTGAPVTIDFVVEVAPVSIAGLRVVAATRTGAAAASLPIKVDVFDAQEIEVQQTLSANPTEMLSNLIPSFSPARQKLSTAGESFRGRRPLFLIDGVPQSNPLRDGRRDGFTIDMEAIERVEVIFGANAIQGLGATGGIVNYVTVSPPATGELEQSLSVGMTSGDRFEGDGIGWRGHYMAGKRIGSFDVQGSVSVERRGLQFDGRNRAIGVDNVQGDIADSHSRNFLGKIGWEPAPAQRVQLMFNTFRLEQEGDFALVPGDRNAGVPAISVPGEPEGVEPVNDVMTAAVDYEHDALAGGRFSAKAYYQDFSALFGGGRFATFQDPLIAPVGELFDQSQNNSEKYGARLTYARAAVAGTPLDVITGFDFI